jgi:type II secretory pathway pseudopilin PulG
MTLTEILVAVLIFGICGVAILGGLSTSVFASRLHSQEAQVESVLDSAVESVKATGEVPCATPSTGTYKSAITSILPAGWTASNASITSIQYWDGTTWGSHCYDNAAEDAFHLMTLQLVTIKVTHPSATPPCTSGVACTTDTISFVKSR